MGKGKKVEAPPKPWKAVTTDKHDKDVKNLPPAAQEKYHAFIDKINEGKHPKTAAEETGDMHYARLKGDRTGAYEVRLDGENRLTGHLGEDQTHKTFTVHQVGGHTKQKK